jgi:hypothetical protein
MIDQAAAHRKKIVQELEALKARAVASPVRSLPSCVRVCVRACVVRGNWLNDCRQGGMRDGKEGARNEFRKSFHPAAFHRTQSGPNIDEKKDDEAQPSSSLSAGSFSPVRESSSYAARLSTSTALSRRSLTFSVPQPVRERRNGLQGRKQWLHPGLGTQHIHDPHGTHDTTGHARHAHDRTWHAHNSSPCWLRATGESHRAARKPHRQYIAQSLPVGAQGS